jgi:hypothetical protein
VEDWRQHLQNEKGAPRRLSHHVIAAAQYEWASIHGQRIRTARR